MKILIGAIALGFAILGVAYVALPFFGDPLSRLQLRAARDPGLLTGPGTIVKLPDKASPDAVARTASPGCTVEDVRKIEGDRTAVLIESAQGQKILVLQYEENIGWLVETRDAD